jgi:hypothetical protein
MLASDLAPRGAPPPIPPERLDAALLAGVATFRDWLVTEAARMKDSALS